MFRVRGLKELGKSYSVRLKEIAWMEKNLHHSAWPYSTPAGLPHVLHPKISIQCT